MEPELICERFQKLALDVVGPLPRSKSGYAYILTGMDLATSFSFAFPMKGYTASETALNLLKIIHDIGPPAAILTDQGTNFKGKVMQEVTSKLAISTIKTTPYHPQSNGQLERYHSTLKSVLRKAISNKCDRPLILDLAV